MKPDSLRAAVEMGVDLFDNWFDPIETEVRARSRQFIEELIRSELNAVLACPRYVRSQMTSSQGRANVARARHQPDAVADRRVQTDLDRGAARPAEHPRGQDDGMGEPGAGPRIRSASFWACAARTALLNSAARKASSVNKPV